MAGYSSLNLAKILLCCQVLYMRYSKHESGKNEFLFYKGKTYLWLLKLRSTKFVLLLKPSQKTASNGKYMTKLEKATASNSN